MDATSVAHFRSFRSPVGTLWPHLTRPELLAGWLGAADLELTPGGGVTVEAWNGDTASGQILVVSPPVKLEMAWRPYGLDQECRLSWRLEGDGPGSRLTVTQDHLKSGEERSAARRTWREALGALRRLVDGGTPAADWGATIPIAIRTTLGRPASELWPLLSTGAGIEKWVAHVERFDGEPGGQFRLTSRYHGTEVVEEGRIEEIVPESRLRLAWEWTGQGWGAITRVDLSLEAGTGGTALLLVHSGFETIATDKAAAARRNYATAWPGVIQDLRRLLSPAAAGPPPARSERSASPRV